MIGGGSQLLVKSPGPLGLERENYWKTGVEAWISRHVELYYLITCPPSYILVLLAAYYRGFVHPYEWLSALIGCRR